MNNNEKDILKSETETNNMKEYGEFDMQDFNFLPTLEMVPFGEPSEDPEKSFDITDLMSDEDIAHY
jgi:hypothetical protein